MATPLTHLPEVERLSPLVIRILGGNPGKVFLSTIRIKEIMLLLTWASLRCKVLS